MTTKAELILKMEALVSAEDTGSIAEQVEHLKEAYEALIADAQQLAEETDEADESAEEAASEARTPEPTTASKPEPIESAQLTDEEDKRFKQLLDNYHQQVNELRRAKAKEETDNLVAKQGIMDELKRMIAEEENIGTAFQRFKELQEQWKAIGNVPQQAYSDLQRDYSHLLDEFFYHIRIYKELRDHDLRKNTALKRALIADMEDVQRVDNVRDAERLVRELQEKWHQIGPALKEEWESIRDAFWTATRIVNERIHEHYKARRAEHEANLEAKQNLVDKVKLLAENTEEAGTKEWKNLTDQVLEMQTAWKSIGFATKKENERIWKEFRAVCNVFFQKKKEYFDAQREKYKDARQKKATLVKQANELRDSTEWKQTADKLKGLQQEWKDAGSAGPRDEQRLWSQFREACDHFFKSRKANFAKLDEEQAVHVKEREALIAEIDAFTSTGQRQADMNALKEFSKRWMECGRVSPKQFDALIQRYRAALDKQYDALKMEGEERRRMQFQDHIEDIRSAPDPKSQFERESRILKRKISELETEILQFEDRMGMFNFKSASGEAMKKDMEKKMDRSRREVERLKQQQGQLERQLK